MGKIENLKWDPEVLKKYDKVSDDLGNMIVYKTREGTYLKVCNEYYYNDYHYFYDIWLPRVIKDSEYIELEDIIKPIKAYYDDKEMIKAYEVPTASGISLDKYLPKIRVKDSDAFFSVCTKLSERVQLANEEDIIFPDLAFGNNVFYDPKTDKFSFIDFDGIQIKDTPSMCISGMLNKMVEPLNNEEKYGAFNNGLSLYKDNLDKFSLATLFFYYSNGYNIGFTLENLMHSRCNNGNGEINDIDLNRFMNYIKLKDDDFREYVRLFFDKEKDNMYLHEVLPEFSKKYTLSRNKFGKRTFEAK